MKFILLPAIFCLAFIPSGTFAALTNCAADLQCPTNAKCSAANTPCVCDPGYHENADSSGCAQDIALDATCTTADSETECIANAVCMNVAQQGQPAQLQCTCKSGFHKNTADPPTCEADIALDATCTTENSETECIANAVCMNVAQQGQPAQLQCTCKSGFHKNAADPPTCEADIALDATCTTENSETECIANAVCMNVAQQGQPAQLQCTCKSGFHKNAADPPTCEADIALDATCTTENSETECIANAVCMNVAQQGQPAQLQCTCKSGFHKNAADPPTCEADIALDATCTTENSETECIANAVCMNVAQQGQPAQLQCACKSGFHKNTADPPTCEADIAVGQTCTAENSATVCVEFATCANTQPSGQTVELKCTCNTGYHEVDGTAGMKLCAADTCQYTIDTCTAAGMTSCEELNTFIGCVLQGACDPQNTTDVGQFEGAMENVRTKLPADCAAAASTTCTDKVTGCFNTNLKEANSTCTTTEALTTCLTSAKTTCDAETNTGPKVYALATAYATQESQDFSCECVKALTDCSTTQKTSYEAEGATNATKCTATKELFTCALTPLCDLTKTIDHNAVKDIWSMAMTWAQATGCGDTVTEADATTCPLQLTRCALIYTQSFEAAGTNKSASCRAAEAFGTCVNTKTAACTDDQADKKKLFLDQYTLASSTCGCMNELNQCYDEVGVLTTDPAVACPKLASYSRCIMNTKCSLVDQDDLTSVKASQQWYTNRKANNNCSITSDKSCSKDAEVCSDKLVTDMSKSGISNADMCTATKNAMMCVFAANCSSDVEADVSLVNSTKMAGQYRLASLGCDADFTCTRTYSDLMACQATYDSDFTQAGDNNENKCKVTNNMVECLKNFTCNANMEDVVQGKYDAVKNVNVPNCEVQSLTSSNSAPSLHTVVLVVLTSVIAGVLAIRL